MENERPLRLSNGQIRALEAKDEPKEPRETKSQRQEEVKNKKLKTRS
jgi:hypothetical protein